MNDADAKDFIQLTLSRDELILLNNALNEVCNGTDFSEGEFHARLGASREEARNVLERIARALDELSGNEIAKGS